MRSVGGPVTATDPDTADMLSYSLGGTDASSFTINSSTGQLSTAAEFDHETKASYTVTVTATDPGMLNASVTVNISVTNVDEDGTVSLSSSTPQVETGLTATLSDPDGYVEWFRVGCGRVRRTSPRGPLSVGLPLRLTRR